MTGYINCKSFLSGTLTLLEGHRYGGLLANYDITDARRGKMTVLLFFIAILVSIPFGFY